MLTYEELKRVYRIERKMHGIQNYQWLFTGYEVLYFIHLIDLPSEWNVFFGVEREDYISDSRTSFRKECMKNSASEDLLAFVTLLHRYERRFPNV